MLSLTCGAPGWSWPVPIHALLDKQHETRGIVLSPEDITAIVAAYDKALERLKVPDRKAPMALLVAKSTLELAKEGERDPERLCERVMFLYRIKALYDRATVGYRQLARDCHDVARSRPSGGNRTILLDMAREWDRLADQQEQVGHR
jgi:hypothetical protein